MTCSGTLIGRKEGRKERMYAMKREKASRVGRQRRAVVWDLYFYTHAHAQHSVPLARSANVAPHNTSLRMLKAAHHRGKRCSSLAKASRAVGAHARRCHKRLLAARAWPRRTWSKAFTLVRSGGLSCCLGRCCLCAHNIPTHLAHSYSDGPGTAQGDRKGTSNNETLANMDAQRTWIWQHDNLAASETRRATSRHAK